MVLGALLLLGACAGTGTHVAAPPERSALATPELPDRFTLSEVAANTFVFNEAVPWSSNVLLALMPDQSLVLVNAPATAAATRELLAYIRQRFGTGPLTVVNSHHHIDSVGGNAVLRDAGATVIASSMTAALTGSDTANQRDDVVRSGLVPEAFVAEFTETQIAQPTQTFEAQDGLTMRIAGEEVRVIYPGPAHSVDNAVVFFPARGVLFGGCMVRSGDTLGPTDHADLAHWPTAIATLQALSPVVVVPGHGIRHDAEQLTNTLNLLRAP